MRAWVRSPARELRSHKTHVETSDIQGQRRTHRNGGRGVREGWEAEVGRSARSASQMVTTEVMEISLDGEAG